MYIAPLRHAVVHLGSAATPFTADAVACLGSAGVAAARGYLAKLVWQGVLLDLSRDRYAVTSAFASWAGERPKTKPGGHRKVRYRAVERVEHAHAS